MPAPCHFLRGLGVFLFLLGFARQEASAHLPQRLNTPSLTLPDTPAPPPASPFNQRRKLTLALSFDYHARRQLLREFHWATSYDELNRAGRTTSFGYRADGLLSTVSAGGQTFSFSYGDQGLIGARTGGGRTQSVSARDSRGRILNQSATVGAATPLSESQSWDGRSRRTAYNATRTGGGTWNDARGYVYNERGQVYFESSAPAAGTAGNFLYRFDFESLSVAPPGSGLGVRTAAMWRLGADPDTYQAGSHLTYDPALFGSGWRGVDAFSRPTNEAAILAPNTGWLGYSSHDEVGQLTWRSYWTPGATPAERQQTLTWDGFGRLAAVQDGDMTWSDGYLWKATYDGLGRRLRTTRQALSSGTPTGPVTTIDSQYDPEVEFLEVAVALDGARTWQVHGPDLNGGYGALQGIGGLEATITEATGAVRTAVSDSFGNVVGHVNGGSFLWHTAQAGSYGVLPGSTALTLETAPTVIETLVWRSRRIDPTGFYYSGARYYDPQGGRFISPDPLGHGASMSLYDYCDNDPVNRLDPDGRLSTQIKSYSGDLPAPFPVVFYAPPRGDVLKQTTSASEIRSWVNEAAAYQQIPPVMLATILQQENGPNATKFQKFGQFGERTITTVSARVDSWIGIVPDKLSGGSSGWPNMSRATLEGAANYSQTTYNRSALPDDVRYRALGVDTDTRIPGYDIKADLYYSAAHIRELIDRTTGIHGVNDTLTVEQARLVFRRYNGSGPLAEKYANDAQSLLLKAAKGEATLFFFERK